MSLLQNRGIAAFLGGILAPRSLGGVVAPDNAVATETLGSDTFTDLDLGSSAVLSSNAVGWILSDATTGELTYQGSAPFSGIITVSMTLENTLAQVDTIRAVRNGSPLPENALSSAQIATNEREVSLVTPVTMVSGDTLRMQISTLASQDVLVSNFSMQVY